MRGCLIARLAASIGTSLALLGGAGVALAQEDGVFVDPDSPAGKEYALPLDAARRDATGGGGSAAPGGDAPPLFGGGISQRGSAKGGSRAGAEDGQGKGTPSGDGGGNAPTGAGGVGAGEAVAKAVAESTGGPSAGGLTALIALGVMLVGVAVGLTLRSLRGTDQPS